MTFCRDSKTGRKMQSSKHKIFTNVVQTRVFFCVVLTVASTILFPKLSKTFNQGFRCYIVKSKEPFLSCLDARSVLIQQSDQGPVS